MKQFITGPYAYPGPEFSEVVGSGGGSFVSGCVLQNVNTPVRGPADKQRIGDRIMIHKIEVDFEIICPGIPNDIPYAVDLLMYKDTLLTAQPTLLQMINEVYQFDLYGIAAASNLGLSSRSFFKNNYKDHVTVLHTTRGLAKNLVIPPPGGSSLLVNNFCKNHRFTINRKIPWHFQSDGAAAGTAQSLLKNAFLIVARAGGNSDRVGTNKLVLNNYTIRYWYTDA